MANERLAPYFDQRRLTEVSPVARQVMAETVRRGLIRSFRSNSMRAIAIAAFSQGWTGKMGGSGHVILMPPGGQGKFLSLSATQSEGPNHLLRNAMAKARRAGITLPIDSQRKEHATMPKGQATTDEQIAQIGELRREGLPVSEIAKKVGVSTKTVGVYSPPELLRAHAPRGAGRTHSRAGSGLASRATGISIRQASREEFEGFGRNGHGVPVSIEITERGQKLIDETLANHRAEEGQSVADAVRDTAADLAEYPAIRTLADKQSRYASMLTDAERMGDEDLQLVLLEKTKLTPLETEILAFWQTHRGQRNGSH